MPRRLGLLVVAALFKLGSAAAEQVTFRLDLGQPAANVVTGEGLSTARFTVAAGTQRVPVLLEVVLTSALEPCVSRPSACDGSENFVETDAGGRPVYGCHDGTDNDADGQVDMDDPDCIGVQGWSLALEAGACFRFAGATSRGTVTDLNVRPPGLRDPEGNFLRIFEDEHGGLQLAAAAVLSFTRPIFLPQVGEFVVLNVFGSLDTEGTAPGEIVACSVRIVPPCEDLFGKLCPPVFAAANAGGNTITPAVRNLVLEAAVDTALPPAASMRIDIVDPPAVSGEPGPMDLGAEVLPWSLALPENEAVRRIPVRAAVVLESRFEPCLFRSPACSGGERFVERDPTGNATRYGCGDGVDNDADGLTDLGDADCIGVGGWQVQVQTPPCFHLSGATTGGTVADLPPVGERDRDASFHRTEFLGPESFLPGAALSAVVLSLRHPVVLPSVSDTVILRLSGALDLPPPGTEASPPCLLELVADEPVDEAGSLPGTLVFVHGERLAPYLRHAEVRLAPREGLFPDPMFIRGDPNRDGRVNLADAVWIVSELFGRGPSTLCLEAADANDDTFVDLSDVVYLIRYQLGGGPSPLDPFPECGPDAWPRLLRGGPGCDLGVSCEAPS